jgi:hypothetical protein
VTRGEYQDETPQCPALTNGQVLPRGTDKEKLGELSEKFMRVDPNHHVPDPSQVAPTKPKTAAAAPNAEQNATDFAASTQLTKAMEKIPLVRSDKVAMAKQLVQNPNYPDDATLRKVADVVTDHLKPEEPS